MVLFILPLKGVLVRVWLPNHTPALVTLADLRYSKHF